MSAADLVRQILDGVADLLAALDLGPGLSLGIDDFVAPVHEADRGLRDEFQRRARRLDWVPLGDLRPDLVPNAFFRDVFHVCDLCIVPLEPASRGWARLLGVVQERAAGAPPPANNVAGLKDDDGPAAREAYAEFQVRRAARLCALSGIEGRKVEQGPHGADLATRIAGRPQGSQARRVIALRPALDEAALLFGERARAHHAAMEKDFGSIEVGRRAKRDGVRGGPVAEVIDRKLLRRAGRPFAALRPGRDLRLRQRGGA